MRKRHIAKRWGISDAGVAHEFLEIILVGSARLSVVDVGEQGQRRWHVGQLMEGCTRQRAWHRRGLD